MHYIEDNQMNRIIWHYDVKSSKLKPNEYHSCYFIT